MKWDEAPKFVGPPDYDPPVKPVEEFGNAFVDNLLAQGDPAPAPEPPKPKPEAGSPLSLEELEEAKNRALRQMVKNIGHIHTRELPRMLEIINSAIGEKKTRGELGVSEKTAPTRAQMIEMLQGRKAGSPP